MPIKIITDSTSYIPQSLREELDITIISLSVNFENESFLEENIDNNTFYEKMSRSKNIPTSSQPNLQAFYNLFEKHVQDGNIVVGVFISSDMSGTFSTASTAKGMIVKKYPEAKIELIDSRSNSMELGFVAVAVARAAKNGESLEQVLYQAHNVIAKSRFLFIPESLEHLKKGGRIGGATALIGSLLQIKPILTVTNGKTEVFNKVRTKNKAIQCMLEAFYSDVEQKGLVDAVIHHINNEAEGKKIAGIIKKRLGYTVPVCAIGPVVGLHVGPGTIGLVYYTKD